MPASEITTALERHGAIAVLRLKDGRQLRAVVDALLRGGVRAIELTMTVPDAIEQIAEIAPTLPADAVLGAGTVLDVATAERARDAGASFIVSPVLKREIVDAFADRDVAVVPGCYTPTEIVTAGEAGANLGKGFPATSLGPAYIRDILAPLPQLKLVPTGGIAIDAAGDWIRAGAAAVGVGGALVDGRAVAAGDFDTIARAAERLVASVCAARNHTP